MKTIETIENYLDGKLEGKDLNEFKSKVNSDADFAKEIDLHRFVNKSIADDDLQDFRLLIAKMFARKESVKTKYIRIFSTVAAMAIILISVVSITKQQKTDDVFTTFYTPYQTDLNTRSANFIAKDFEKGFSLYQNGEYLKAFKLFEANTISVKTNCAAEFYYGLCALETGNYKVSEQSFKNVINSENSPFALHANWYLALLYLKTGEKDKALVLLKKLTSEENYYSTKAELIKKDCY